MKGNLWFGWGVFCGIPGTIVAFAIKWPLGVVVGGVTLAALWYGAHLEREADVQRKLDDDAKAMRARAKSAE